MDALCYGPGCFGQLFENNCKTLLEQIKQEENSLKCVTLSWNKCYIILNNETVIIKGFVDRKSYNQKIITLPFCNQLKKITCLEKYDLFLTEDGDLYKYSENKWEFIRIPKEDNISQNDLKIADICSSEIIHLALSNNGSIFSIPVKIEVPFPLKVKKVACGFEHCLCLVENGSVYAWGAGSRGQIGNNLLKSVEHPEVIVALDGLEVIDVDAGGWHSTAVTIFGDLYTWGWNNSGQLGFPTDEHIFDDHISDYVTVLAEPKVVDWPNNKEVHVKLVTCGTRHTVVTLEDGSIWGCGWNKYGQLNPFSVEKYFDKMIMIPVPNNVHKVHRVSAMSWYTILYFDCKRNK